MISHYAKNPFIRNTLNNRCKPFCLFDSLWTTLLPVQSCSSPGHCRWAKYLNETSLILPPFTMLSSEVFLPAHKLPRNNSKRTTYRKKGPPVRTNHFGIAQVLQQLLNWPTLLSLPAPNGAPTCQQTTIEIVRKWCMAWGFSFVRQETKQAVGPLSFFYRLLCPQRQT